MSPQGAYLSGRSLADDLITGAIAPQLPLWCRELFPTVHVLRSKTTTKGTRFRIQVKFKCKCSDTQSMLWSCKGKESEWPAGVRDFVQDKHGRCWEGCSGAALSAPELQQRLSTQTKLVKRKSSELATVKASPPPTLPHALGDTSHCEACRRISKSFNLQPRNCSGQRGSRSPRLTSDKGRRLTLTTRHRGSRQIQ
jgi:hypothetical protein